MRIVKIGSRKIKVYFNEKKVNEREKAKGGYYINAYCDRSKDAIYVRTSIHPTLQRICLWHDLNHLLYDFLDTMGSETSAEISARYVDEILIRNKWVRELYKKEEK